MEANLTRYDIWVEGDCHESELVVEKSESGEWVKFADAKESLSKSRNSKSAPCYRCSDYSTCDKKIAHILPQCFKQR